jgi:hypothetical protein
MARTGIREWVESAVIRARRDEHRKRSCMGRRRHRRAIIDERTVPRDERSIDVERRPLSLPSEPTRSDRPPRQPGIPVVSS